MISNILVALDGSEVSGFALDYAVEFATKWGVGLTVLVVVPRVMLPISPMSLTVHRDLGQYKERMRTWYRNILKEAQEKVSREHSDMKVVTRLIEGRPSAAIVDLAEDEGFDLIVIGSRGIGGITGWILGSTSRRVADSCTKPVLIVKHRSPTEKA